VQAAEFLAVDEMSNLQSRLRKLEAHLTDSSGLVPHSPAWMDHWTQELKKVIAEDYRGPKAPIPLEVVRACIRGEPDCP
jgi:hypothetical protein